MEKNIQTARMPSAWRSAGICTDVCLGSFSTIWAILQFRDDGYSSFLNILIILAAGHRDIKLFGDGLVTFTLTIRDYYLFSKVFRLISSFLCSMWVVCTKWVMFSFLKGCISDYKIENTCDNDQNTIVCFKYHYKSLHLKGTNNFA